MLELIFAVAVLSTAILLGWVLAGSTWITHILPDAVTMKPATALSFVMISIGMIMGRRRHIALALMITGAAITWLAQFGLVPFLDLESSPTRWSVAANVPSWATTLAATMIAIGGVWRCWWVSGVAAAIGATSLTGYALHIPTLFFYVQDVSTAMAFHTAAFFLIIGIAGAMTQHRVSHHPEYVKIAQQV